MKRSLSDIDDDPPSSIFGEPLRKRNKISHNVNYDNDNHHQIWWKNNSFTISSEQQKNLDQFYEETVQKLHNERQTNRINCCCMPYVLLKCDDKNEKAKALYQKAIEDSINIYDTSNGHTSINSDIMSIIWAYLGNLKCDSSGSKKNRECTHCGNYLVNHV